MRNVPVGIRIPQPEQVLGVEFVDNLIYDSHKPEQAFAVSDPDIGDAYTETFPTHPNTPSNFQVSMTGEDASLTWTKSDGTGALGDIVAHWLTVGGATESTDAGSSASLSALDADKIHVFQVQALDSANNFSKPATLRVSPLSISKTQGTTTSQTIKVETPGPDLHDEIELYRATSRGGPYTKIHTFTDPSASQTYQDTGLAGVTTYYYEARGVELIAAVDVKSSEGAFSTEPVAYDLTVDSTKVGSDLTGFPVFVDLSNMPSGFFSKVSADGSGIRVKDPNGNTIPREVVYVDKNNNEGELHFKGDLSASSDTTFTIEITDNAAPAATDPNGRNAVWDRFEAVFHLQQDPTTGVVDSTGNGYDATAQGGMDSASLVSGLLGNAIEPDADGEYLELASSIPLGRDFTFHALAKIPLSSDDEGFFGPIPKSDSDPAFDINNGNQWRVKNGNGNQFAPVTDLSVADTWATYGLRGNSGGGTYYFYINGAEDNTVGDGGTDLSGVQALLTKGHSDFLRQRLYGPADEYRFSVEDLGADWIDAEDTNLRSPTTLYTVQ